RLNAPDGPWLDIGCGRGEWLSAASKSGHPVRGIDSNARSAAYCRQQGFDAVHAEALEYLQDAPDESVAVISAFHVVEHVTADYLLSVFQEIARVLKPGGLLILETPDPANLLMGSHLFWRDITHNRPLPMLLLELILDYFGFRVAERLHLNPSPKTEWLPFGE